MFDTELIVYVVKDKSQKYDCGLTEVVKLKKSLTSEKVKIVYFEKFENRRKATSRYNKIQLLDRLKLVELIKGSNPEMLNLINCI